MVESAVRAGWQRCPIVATARAADDKTWNVTLKSDRLLYAVHFDVTGFLADDNYFHLTPGREKIVGLRNAAGAQKLSGYVEAMNLDDAVRIVV